MRQISPVTAMLSVYDYAGYNEATQEEDLVYLAVNSGWFPVTLTLPELPEKYKWHVASTPEILNVSFFTKIQCPR